MSLAKVYWKGQILLLDRERAHAHARLPVQPSLPFRCIYLRSWVEATPTCVRCERCLMQQSSNGLYPSRPMVIVARDLVELW